MSKSNLDERLTTTSRIMKVVRKNLLKHSEPVMELMRRYQFQMC